MRAFRAPTPALFAPHREPGIRGFAQAILTYWRRDRVSGPGDRLAAASRIERGNAHDGIDNRLGPRDQFVATGWKWNAANLALGSVVLLLTTYLWLSHHWDLEERRRNLIADVLWAEQTLRFHLQADEDSIVALGQEAVERQLNAADFERRVQQLVRNNPELLKATLLDDRGSIALMFPVSIDKEGARNLSFPEHSAETQDMASRMGKPAYSEVYQGKNGDSRFMLVVPVFRDGAPAGRLICEFSLGELMRHLVPWWYAEKYQLTMLDATGTVLATKSNINVSNPDLSYDVTVTPPGSGITLRATAYALESNVTRNLFLAAIIVLSMLTLWSLLTLRRDMARRLAIERELRAQYAFRRAMEDSMLTGIVVKDLAGRVTYVNPAFCRMTGFSREQQIGALPLYGSEAEDGTASSKDAEEQSNAAPTGDGGIELRYRCRNGGMLNVLVHEAPLIDANGRVSGRMASVLDITERRRAQDLAREQSEKLQVTARLVAVGEMASTLAHELNQPLSVITSFVTGALNRLQAGKLRNEDLQQVLETTACQAKRAGKIVQRVHEFVRRREPRRDECDINRVTETALGFLETEARHSGIRIHLDATPGIYALHADGVLLEQVVFNLAKNGIEALAGTPPERRELSVRTASDGCTITVSISDRGCGIPPAVIPRLFTPFFTTKDGGMGMGLNICRSIIEFHSGKLWFEPNVDGGSTFCFSLPLSEA